MPHKNDSRLISPNSKKKTSASGPRFFFFFLFFFAENFALRAQSDDPSLRWQITAGSRLFFLSESDSAGENLVRESGFLHEIRGGFEGGLARKFYASLSAKAGFGRVKYTGKTFGRQPVTSFSLYREIEGDLRLFYLPGREADGRFSPYLLFQYTLISRQLGDGKSYSEQWKTKLLGAGIQFRRPARSEIWKLCLEAAWPAGRELKVSGLSVLGYPDVVYLEPGNGAVFGSRLSWQKGIISVAFFTEGKFYAESEELPILGLYQPASRWFSAGLRAGIRF